MLTTCEGLSEQRQLSTSFKEQTITKAFIVHRYKMKGALRFGDMPEPALRDDDVLVMKRSPRKCQRVEPGPGRKKCCRRVPH